MTWIRTRRVVLALTLLSLTLAGLVRLSAAQSTMCQTIGTTTFCSGTHDDGGPSRRPYVDTRLGPDAQDFAYWFGREFLGGRAREEQKLQQQLNEWQQRSGQTCMVVGTQIFCR